jgi:hypothetical protein
MIRKIFMGIIECLRIIILIILCFAVGSLVVDDLIYDLDFIPNTPVMVP